MKPSLEEVNARVDDWHNGLIGGGLTLRDALGWTHDEYAAWMFDSSAIPDRPLPELPRAAKIRIPPIPRQTSADREHPWFWPFSAYVHVFLDGKRLTQCVHADADAGEVWVYNFKHAGFALDILKGVVTLEPAPIAFVDESMVIDQ